MYLQSRREAKAAKNKKDVEQPSKLEEKSVLADVILQTAPREAQVGSPIMNGYRKGISNDISIANKENEKGGETNKGFVKDDQNHEDFERKQNEINKNISESKGGVENEGFDGDK